MSGPDWLEPGWPAPAGVRALMTTRRGGVSRGPFAAFNLGDRAGDDADAVAVNREALRASAGLPMEPAWLRQVHGQRVSVLDATPELSPEADGAVTRAQGVVCAVQTADCLPILLCSRDGSRVGAVHAGWRGLAGGVLEAALAQWAGDRPPMAWLGPAIGPNAFEVGNEVRAAFLARDGGLADCFRPSGTGGWLADLFALARARLNAAGISEVYGGGLCTYSDPARFYSYRRDGTTGRMAALIWRVQE